MAANDLIGTTSASLLKLITSGYVDFVLKKKQKVAKDKQPKFKRRFIAIRPFAKKLEIFATQEGFEFEEEPMIRIDLTSGKVQYSQFRLILQVFSIRIDVNRFIQITAKEADYAIKPEDETAADRWLHLFKKNSLTVLSERFMLLNPSRTALE